MPFCLVSLAPVVFTLIISQLLSCSSALCGLVLPSCNVAGDVIVGAEGTSGYISFLESSYMVAVKWLVVLIRKIEIFFGLIVFGLLCNLAVVFVAV